MKDDSTKQRRYRRRYDDGGIAPDVEISSRAQEALRRRAALEITSCHSTKTLPSL
jgi:hypothetical protein